MPIRRRHPTVLRLSLPLILIGGLLSAPVAAQTRQLSDEQIGAIEYHYHMDRFFVAGCLIGATFGAVTGVMTLSGYSIIAAVPYISTGCSVGFLVGGGSMVVGEFLASALHGKPTTNQTP